MLTLNQDYETEIVVPVHIRNIPDDVGFSASGDDELVVKVRDGGTTLMNYMFTSFLPISVDYEEFKNRKGRLSLPVSQLRKRVEGQLQSSTVVLALQPDSFVYFTRESALRIPVKIQGNYSVAKQYVSGTPIAIPDSVWVYAPESVADTLRAVYTMPFEESELRDSLRVAVALVPVGENVKCVPSEVNVVVPVSPFAEKSFELSVVGVGFPDNYRLRTFPSRVRVVMNVNMSLYDSVSPDDFEIGVRYEDVSAGQSRAVLRLLSVPETVRDVRIVPQEVEYLIEQYE